ncbi:chemotaxis protein CheB [Gaiella sp.]|uniref:chemotaxis protein CheB n=1 Tax=Gaiella sp. TaxID=2663207 RepID=UPI002E2F56E2|nr:chemotaxis protein CheB [Gaiella sp.]HEX5585287.1 chemotaxis protein CheB [Gaiella sp.]
MAAAERIVVVGGSAGGIEALTALVAELPRGLEAAVLVALHVPADATSRLPEILSRAGSMRAEHVEDVQELASGRIFVAPPDRHLVVEEGRVKATRGPRENRHRPAVDPLFRSAARWYGQAVVAVLLSGGLGDGIAGTQAVKERGGVPMIQDPDEALFPGMPASVRDLVQHDHCLPAAEIGRLLPTILAGSAPRSEARDEGIVYETDIAELDTDALEGDGRQGKQSAYGCPECGGVLWELDDGSSLRYRCRVGHAYAVEALQESQSAEIERALWSALRALEEKAGLAQRMADRARGRGHAEAERLHRSRAAEADRQAVALRELLLDPGPLDRPGALEPGIAEAHE